MANSRSTAPLGVGSLRRGPKLIPARTPGPLGRLDAGDPDIRTKSGDTPRSVGVQHHAKPKRRFTHVHQTSITGKLASYDDMAAEYLGEPEPGESDFRAAQGFRRPVTV